MRSFFTQVPDLKPYVPSIDRVEKAEALTEKRDPTFKEAVMALVDFFTRNRSLKQKDWYCGQ